MEELAEAINKTSEQKTILGPNYKQQQLKFHVCAQFHVHMTALSLMHFILLLPRYCLDEHPNT